MPGEHCHRILIVDDNETIHADFRKVLGCTTENNALRDVEMALFADKVTFSPHVCLQIDSAMQGQEAVEMVRAANKEGRAYSLAFVDMRMPPGWDGLETISRMWEIDPQIQAVICTAYSDYSWAEIRASLGQTDQLLLLKKPFEPIEVQQLATALTEKWQLSREAVRARRALSRAVEELRLSNQQLEKNNEELVLARETAEQAQQQAEQACAAKATFMASMSHELRTPMNSIIGFTNRLLKRLGDELAARELDALMTVAKNADHLLGLINGILDFSKVEAGKVPLELSTFDVVQAVRDVASQLKSLVDEKPVELVVDLPPEPVKLRADITKIRQVLTNLISNAIKFTREGTVSVVVSQAQHAGVRDAVCITVRDTGVGIKESELQLLFGKFSQLDESRIRQVGGTGLGLAISDRYVEMHGGCIVVSSEHGRGSEFSVYLPCNVEGESSMRPDSNDSWKPTKQLVIFCAEDDPESFVSAKQSLEHHGHHVVLANDIATAAAKTAELHPNVLLLDICVPIIRGRRVSRDLREHPILRHIPVTLVSIQRQGESSSSRRGPHRFAPRNSDGDELRRLVSQMSNDHTDQVLYVDADSSSHQSVKQALAVAGLIVHAAETPEEGVRLLAENNPQMVIIDLSQLGSNGSRFLKRLHRDPVWRLLPVLILTSLVEDVENAAKPDESMTILMASGAVDAQRIIRGALERTGGCETQDAFVPSGEKLQETG